MKALNYVVVIDTSSVCSSITSDCLILKQDGQMYVRT